MGRWIAIAAALYGLGHPGFEAYRPAAFERSLREFHRDVNRLANVASRSVALPDAAPALRSLHSLSANLQMMLSGR